MAEGFPTGFSHTLNEQQKNALATLWGKCKNNSPEAFEFLQSENLNPEGDRFLLRFLRATMDGKGSKGKRLFQIDAAFERLVDSLEFRNKCRVDEEPPEFDKFCTVRPLLIWNDETLHTPIFAEKSGHFWSKVNPKQFTEEQWLGFLGHVARKLEIMIHKCIVDNNQKDSKGLVAIIDIGGLGYSVRAKKDLFKLFNRTLGAHFPELVDTVSLINAPYIFSAVWSVAKHIIDPDLKSKISIYSSTPKKEFAHRFNVEQLPKNLGGKSGAVLMESPGSPK